jgi:type VI secretion system protein ImpL
MVGGAAKQTESRTAGEAREKVNAAWKGDVLPFCRKAIGGRFPFAQSSGVDASIDDVVRLFGPSGMIPGFIKTQLASLVDTSRQPWRDQQGIGLSSGALAQLARADQISSALFAAGAGPKASFTLTPLTLDADSASVTLDVDGQAMQYAHGPARPSPFTWPGPGGSNIVRLTFAPVSGGAPVSVVKEGAWSLFRLLHEADFVRTDQPDVFEVTMNGGGHSARFRLRAASVENPFDLRMLSGFACPDGL